MLKFRRRTVIVLNDSQNQIAVCLSTSNTNPRPSVTAAANKTCISEDRLSNPSAIPNVNAMNQQLYLSPTSERSQSQFQIGSHMAHLNQSQSLDGDNLIQSKQSNSVVSKYSNVKCGNYGEKGHLQMSKVSMAEESARREAKLEKQRHQKEEKRKQDVETIHMLGQVYRKN